MLDATGDVLRLYYKNMRCDVSFLQSSVSAIFYACKIFSCLQQCKNYKNRSRFFKAVVDFSKLWSLMYMYCHLL